MKEIFIQLILATFLGALIGLEREIKRKEAGIQTYSLVALGSCLFTVLAFNLFTFFEQKIGIRFDPTGLIQAIAIGMGFIGAGVIFRQSSGVVGLTTAAALWATAAVGISVGMKLYSLSVFSVILVLFILIVFGFLEKKYIEKENK